MQCIFCQIIEGTLAANRQYEDEEILAFDDNHPKAPVHILLIPKLHLPTLNEACRDQSLLLGKLLCTAQALAAEHKISESGYRLVMNCNRDGGQEVFHMHLHLLGGHRLLAF